MSNEWRVAPGMAGEASMGRGVLGLTAACLAAGFALGFLAAPENETARSAALRAPAPALPPDAPEVVTAEKLAPVPASASAKPESKGLQGEPARPQPKLAPDSPRKSPNYALAANGATVSGGQHPELLTDGNHSQYDGANGYAQTEWTATPPQAFVIAFKQAEPVNAIRFLLWDQDNRFYRYKLDVCPDMDDAKWKTVADRTGSNLECRSWQVLMISTETVRRVRLTGTFGSANSGFHVVEFEAYDAPGGLSKPWEDVDF